MKNYNLLIYIKDIKANENLTKRFVSLTPYQKQLLSIINGFKIENKKTDRHIQTLSNKKTLTLSNFLLSYKLKTVPLFEKDAFSGNYSLISDSYRKTILKTINKVYLSTGLKTIVYVTKGYKKPYDTLFYFNLIARYNPSRIGFNPNKYLFFDQPNLKVSSMVFIINYGRECLLIPNGVFAKNIAYFVNETATCNSDSNIEHYIDSTLNKINDNLLENNYNILKYELNQNNIPSTVKLKIVVPKSVRIQNIHSKKVVSVNQLENISLVKLNMDIFDDSNTNLINFDYVAQNGFLNFQQLIFLLIIVLAVLVSIVVVIFFFIKESKSSKPFKSSKLTIKNKQSISSDDPRLRPIISYITSNLKLNIPTESSRINLINAGWSDELIDKAIEIIENSENQNKSSNSNNLNSSDKLNNSDLSNNPNDLNNSNNSNILNSSNSSNGSKNLNSSNGLNDGISKTPPFPKSRKRISFDIETVMQTQKQIIDELLPNVLTSEKTNLLRYIIASIKNQKSENEIINKLSIYGWRGKNITTLINYLYNYYHYYY